MPTDFAATRAQFDLPPGVIYLDGNSLGPPPRAAVARVAQTMTNEWGKMLIGAWNEAGWMTMPMRVGDRIGRLIGAAPGTTVMGDTLSIKAFQALAAAIDLVPGRRVILSDSGNFPSDLYMAQGLLALIDRGHELRVVAPEAVHDAIDGDVGVVMLTHVDYRTGRAHDMAAITRKAHDCGAITLWDLAHSVGAVPIDVTACDADFVIGCTYKYLNGGPGSPAFITVAPRWADIARPALAGWMGHAAPFAFDPDYRPGSGIERMRVGTPPILALAALDAALDVWDQADLADVRARSVALGERLITGLARHCPMLVCASPRDPAARGSHVSFRHRDGYAIIQALIAQNVIGDFRAPDILRFGIAPLYLNEADIDTAIARLADIMTNRRWDDAIYRQRRAVT